MEIAVTWHLPFDLLLLCAFYVGERDLTNVRSGKMTIVRRDDASNAPYAQRIEIQDEFLRYDIYVGAKWLDLVAKQTIIYPDEHEGNWQYQDGDEIVTRFLNGEEVRVICQG